MPEFHAGQATPTGEGADWQHASGVARIIFPDGTDGVDGGLSGFSIS
jgi:hypothetical protein